MAVYNDIDTSAFFTDAAVYMTYKVGKTRYTIKGILDSPYHGVTIADAEFATERITLVLPSKSLPVDAAPGDKVIYECDAYTVQEIQPDGTGVTTLILEASTDLDAP